MERRDEIRIGLLFSSTGPYATIARTMLNGARLAIDEVNADPAFPFTLAAATADPGGRNAEYAAATQHFLGAERLVHVVGCYTSSSRKEVLPLFEKHDALLWYPSHYEGFESSENVVYTGAAPNQHIVPLAEHLLRHHGRTRLLRRLELHLGLGEQQDHARGGPGRRRPGPGRALLPGRRDRLRRGNPADPGRASRLRLQHADRRLGLRLLPRLPRRRPRQGRRPAARRAGGELQPGRARAGRDRARGLRRPRQLVGLLREYRHARQPGVRRRLPPPLPGGRPDLGRRRSPPTWRSTCSPERSSGPARRTWPRSGPPCPTSPWRRRRAACWSTATTATAT